MLGSGATSAVSSQWEADDRAAEKFTTKFYTAYFTGTSVAGAMQSAAIAMIHEKSAGLHERITGQLLLFMVIIDDPTKGQFALKDP